MGLLRGDTCHNHQDFFIPSGPREAAKVKVLQTKGGMSKTELTNDERSQRIRSVGFNNKTSSEPEAVDARRLCVVVCVVQICTDLVRMRRI